MGDKTSSRAGEVLRLRNLVMIENIRRAEDPAWRDRLERQQVVARLGQRFGRGANPLEAMPDYADRLQARAAGSASSYAPGWPPWRDGRLSGAHAPAAPDAGRNSWKPGSTAQAQESLRRPGPITEAGSCGWRCPRPTWHA